MDFIEIILTGGVTAVSLKKDKKSDQTIVTTITYHDIGGTMWFLLFAIAGIVFLINQTESIWVSITAIVLFPILFGFLHSAQLTRQRELIESVIKNCMV